MGISVAIFIFLLGAFIFWKIAPGFNINRYLLLSGWCIKLGVSIFFVWIFSLSGVDGALIQGDSYNFYFDGQVLHQYAMQDFWGYVKLLLGFTPDNSSLVANELAETTIWSYGNNGDLINDNRLYHYCMGPSLYN